MEQKIKNRISIFVGLLAAVSFCAGFYFVKAGEVSLPQSGSSVTFTCLGSDQPCCQWWYDKPNTSPAKYGPFSFSTGIFNYNTNYDSLKLQFNSDTISEDSSAPTDICGPANPQPIIGSIDSSQNPGEWIDSTGGYLDSPPINWVDNINNYYEKSDRTCAAYDDTYNKITCPTQYNNVAGTSLGDPQEFYDNCINAGLTPYNDSQFGLPTYLTYLPYYGSGIGGTETHKTVPACAGEQINCERDITFTNLNNISCTLKVKDSSGNDIRSCTDTGCSNFEGPNLTSGQSMDFNCLPTQSGSASVAVQSNFKCFAYTDINIALEEEGDLPSIFFFTHVNQFDNTCPTGQSCWCRVNQKTPALGYDCFALHFPMKLTDPANLPSITDTYYLNVSNCSCSIDSAAVTANQDTTMTLHYFNMNPGTGGTPDFSSVGCGPGGTYVSGSGSCNNPGDNSNGTCTFVCSYGSSVSNGNVEAKIENTNSSAECSGNITAQSLTHNECQSQSCVSVSGIGTDECSSDSNCINSSHNECQSQQCVPVATLGTDSCSTDADCASTQRVCQSQKCVSITVLPPDTPGADECSSDGQCSTNHNECQGQSCVSVSGIGTDTCEFNADCVPTPPYASNPKVLSQNYCSGIPGLGQVNFQWDYTGGAPQATQTKYDLQISSNPLPAGSVDTCSNCEVSDMSVPANGLTTDTSSAGLSIAGVSTDYPLSYGTTYHWRVRVWDNESTPVSSAWVVGPDFTTTSHPWPSPYFVFAPSAPLINKPVSFTDSSTCYGPQSCSVSSWDFGDNSALSTDKGVTSHTYASTNASPGYPVTISVCDNCNSDADCASGYTCDTSTNMCSDCCSYTNNVPVTTTQSGVPEWKEISPF